MKPEKKQKTIEKYAGSYFITTNTKKLTIDTTIIAPVRERRSCFPILHRVTVGN